MMDAAIQVAGAVRYKQEMIDRYAEVLQDQLLTHNGHRYYADRGSLETITTTLAVVLMGADADPIPTPGHVAGKWMSADRDQAGGRVLVPMSNGQFKQMARALYDRNAALWGARQVHYATVEAMAAAGATAEQILQYDHTAGWPETIPEIPTETK
jgi:hypothetical protein